jgi:carboxyl-terminal processing protease
MSKRLKDSIKAKRFTGGGIQPDIYVRPDTSGYNPFYAKIAEKKVLPDFVYDVLAARYDAAFIEENLAGFNVTETDFKDFVRYAQNREIIIDPRQLSASKSLILSDMKVLLSKYYLGDAGYYKALNLSDPVVKQALTALQ